MCVCVCAGDAFTCPSSARPCRQTFGGPSLHTRLKRTRNVSFKLTKRRQNLRTCSRSDCAFVGRRGIKSKATAICVWTSSCVARHLCARCYDVNPPGAPVRQVKEQENEGTKESHRGTREGFLAPKRLGGGGGGRGGFFFFKFVC